MATTDPGPTRRRALAAGLAVAACVACCLLPLAAAGGLLAGLASALAGALLPAVLLGSIAAGRRRGVVVATTPHPARRRNRSVRLWR
jgi:hypothetical protein